MGLKKFPDPKTVPLWLAVAINDEKRSHNGKFWIILIENISIKVIRTQLFFLNILMIVFVPSHMYTQLISRFVNNNKIR